MPPKQREMDHVVKRIYERLEQRDLEDGERSLLVLVGDHGMTEVRLLLLDELHDILDTISPTGR